MRPEEAVLKQLEEKKKSEVNKNLGEKKPEEKNKRTLHQRGRELLQKHSRLIFLLAIILIILLAVFWTQIVLYANFMLGNDLTLHLKAEPEWALLSHGENTTMRVQAKITTNPFCKASCSFVFEDLSHGIAIEEESFSLRPSLPLRKEYEVQAPAYGEGLLLYRAQVECSSVSTLLCHTSEEPTTRTALLALEYGLDVEEKVLQSALRQTLQGLAVKVQGILAREEALQKAAEDIPLAEMPLPPQHTLPENLREAHRQWQEERFELTEEGIKNVQEEFLRVENELTEKNATAHALAQRYNLLAGNAEGLYSLAEELSRSTLLSSPFIPDTFALDTIQGTLGEAALLPVWWPERSTLQEKEARLDGLNTSLAEAALLRNEEQRREALLLYLQQDIWREVQCAVAGALTSNCLAHPSAEERAAYFIARDVARDAAWEPELMAACDSQISLREEFAEINSSLSASFDRQNYTLNASFWNDALLVLHDAYNRQRTAALSSLENFSSSPENFSSSPESFSSSPEDFSSPPDNSPSESPSKSSSLPGSVPGSVPESEPLAWLGAWLEERLPPFAVENAPVYSENYSENIAPALASLLPSQLENCTLSAPLFPAEEFSIAPAEIPAPVTASVAADGLRDELRFSFELPAPQCCLKGECQPCCQQECRVAPELYPVVFLHGHAVSKDTSYEYSLEGFNQIQKKLEEEGYINAGATTVYTSREVQKGAWKKINAPLTIRASYYVDLFQEPENYVVVQAKSESIDIYALRLKELLDTIEHRTGRQKVNLVAFSMGGLVARRYLQVFGAEKVNALVMLGTPNKGIAGDVADYCPLTGERRECRDMNAESLFINKLNRGTLPGIPVYNIIGTGCSMNGKQGDGAVLEENAYLEGAKNIVIVSECPGALEPLHLQLRDIERYPEVYGTIREAVSSD